MEVNRERLGNPHQGNHASFIGQSKCQRNPRWAQGERVCGMQCFSCSALTLFVCRQVKHAACKKSWVLVCWCWQFDWNLARLVDIHFSPPLPSSLAPIRSTMETFWYRLTEVILKNCRFTTVVIITSGTSLFLWTSLCSERDFCLCSQLRTVLLTYFRLHQVFGISQGVSK